jgi:phage terminase large subunit
MDGPRVVTIPYRPRRLQVVIHKALKRFNVLVCHRRFGKTVLCINQIIRAALQEGGPPNRRYAYIAPLYKQAKQTAWDYLKFFTAPIEGREVNETELRIDLPNGNRIRLFGADNPDALRGIYLDGAVLDEYADMHPRLWGEVIRPALADRKGWVVFIGTPRGRNQFWDVYEMARNDPAWYAAIFRASETQIIDQEELAALQKQMDPDEFEQELECSFIAAIKGSFYGQTMAELERVGRIGIVDWDRSLSCLTSWDLGWTDDTSIWVYQLARQELRYIDYYEASGQDMAHYAKWLQDKPYVYSKHWFPPDARAKTLASGGKSVIQQATALFGVDKCGVTEPTNLQDDIQATRAILPRSWFDASRCKQGLEALRQYQRTWDSERKVFMPKPLHNWASHGATAFHTGVNAYKGDNPSAFKITAFRSPTLNEAWERQERFGHDEARI